MFSSIRTYFVTPFILWSDLTCSKVTMGRSDWIHLIEIKIIWRLKSVKNLPSCYWRTGYYCLKIGKQRERDWREDEIGKNTFREQKNTSTSLARYPPPPVRARYHPTGSFRFEYEYEFPVPVCRLCIITSPTNLIPSW